ncbi:MAG: hypothetical protein IKE51_02345 [Solobacterium sp.]|nr:hypothetical protein [Solobacterium sp.]
MKTRNDYYLCLILSIITILSLLFKAHIGFDCDEQYAFTIMHRLASPGLDYLVSLYDAYQFSNVFSLPLYFVSTKIGGNVVLTFRYLSIIVISLSHLNVFFFCKKRTNDIPFSILCFLIAITAFPKGILQIEHSILATIILINISFVIFNWLDNRPRPILLGLLLSFLSLIFPTQILLYVPCVLLLLKRKEYKEAAMILATSFIILLCTIIPVICLKGIDGLFNSASLILLDGSHDFSLLLKMRILFHDFYTILLFILKSSIIYITICLVYYGYCKKANKVFEQQTHFTFATASLFLYVTLGLPITIGTPFYFIERYLLIVVVWLVISIHKNNQVLKTILLYYIAVFSICFFTSNNGISANSGYTMTASIIILLYIFLQSHRKSALFLCVCILLSQLSSMIFTARITGTVPNNIFNTPLVKDDSLLPNLYIEKNTLKMLYNTQVIKDNLRSNNVIFVGSDVYMYVLLDKTILAPCTTGTPVYDNQWREYLSKEKVHDLDVVVENDDISPENLIKILEDFSYHEVSHKQIDSGIDIIFFSK